MKFHKYSRVVQSQIIRLNESLINAEYYDYDRVVSEKEYNESKDKRRKELSSMKDIFYNNSINNERNSKSI